MEYPTIYRKRLIPNELILLKDDKILYLDDEVLKTKWRVLRPRKDFEKGYSCYFLKKGFKVSKFLNKNGRLVYYYCDIIHTIYDAETNAYTFIDLLADVIIYPSGFVRVVDLDEIPLALEKGLLTIDLMKAALMQLDSLLKIIYSNQLKELVGKYMEME